MTEYVTGRAARLIDDYSINGLGISSLQLMEKASESVAIRAWEYATEKLGKRGLKAMRVVACSGVGNNGADGICALSILKSMGFENLEAVYVGDPEKASLEFEYQKKRLQKNKIKLKAFDGSLPKADIIIDAVFGIGLRRKVEGEYLELITEINRLRKEMKSYVVAVDIPSGINADSGLNMCEPYEAVRADATVSFGYAKTGHVFGKGPVYTGKLRIADIGYPKLEEAELRKYRETSNEKPIMETDSDFKIYKTSDLGLNKIEEKLARRNSLANKSNYGKLLIIAGSKGMAGAAYLSGYAAFKSGIGMVKYLGPEENRTIVQTLLPEAMYESVDMGALREQLKSSLKWADCVTLGPGLSQSEEAAMLIAVLCEADIRSELEGKCFIIDADALNIIAAHPELEKIYTRDTIITPHIGEFARLRNKTIAEIKADRIKELGDYAMKHGISVVLKDNVSLIAINDYERDGVEIYVNTSGSAALSKAGSGDVLTGAIQGILAVINEGNQSQSYAAHLMNAVYIFGRAGKLAGEKFKEHGSLARDVAKQLPFAMVKDKK